MSTPALPSLSAPGWDAAPVPQDPPTHHYDNTESWRHLLAQVGAHAVANAHTLADQARLTLESPHA